MSKRSLGSLADLAKILEEASNPESAVREDRKESKPKHEAAHRTAGPKQMRVIDPRGKVRYEKRLRAQALSSVAVASTPIAPAPEPAKTPGMTKTAAARVGVNVLETLASAKDAKPKGEQKEQKEQKKKAEPWRRKPGDPIF